MSLCTVMALFRCLSGSSPWGICHAASPPSKATRRQAPLLPWHSAGTAQSLQPSSILWNAMLHSGPCLLLDLLPAFARDWVMLISRSQSKEVLPHLCTAPSPATSCPFSQHGIANNPWLSPQLSGYWHLTGTLASSSSRLLLHSNLYKSKMTELLGFSHSKHLFKLYKNFKLNLIYNPKIKFNLKHEATVIPLYLECIRYMYL